MKFSLSTLPFVDREIDIQLFQLFHTYAIDSVELFAQRPHFDITDQTHLDMVEKIESEIGLLINSLHLPIYFNRFANPLERKKINLCSSDNNIRSNSIREIVRHIEIASRLKIPVVILHTGIENNNENEINNLIEALCFINETAVKNNVLLALENHTTESVSIEILISLIHKVDTDNIGICFDVGHSNIFSNYMSDLTQARRYLFSLHLHDNNGEEDEHLFPYEGIVDFDYIIGFLRTSKFSGVVTLELNGEGINTPDEQREFLRKASTYIKAFENPRLTYSNILEPT